MSWWQRLVRAVRGGPAFDAALERKAMRFVELPGLDPRLEGALTDDAWLVYADWLEEQGDARAELVRRWERREQFEEFVAANAGELFGPLAPALGKRAHPYARMDLSVEWKHGLVRHASLLMERPWRQVPVLLGLPVARFLTSLAVGLVPMEDLFNEEAEEALKHPRARGLRTLLLGDFIQPEECQMSWALLGDVSALWGLMPQLEDVKLRGLVSNLGRIDAPELKRFTRETSGFTRAELEKVMAARMPKLEHLELWFGDPNYGANCTSQDIAPLLEVDRFPALTSLGLCDLEHVDALIEPLSRAPFLPRLKRVDLSKGIMTDDGAVTLLRLRDRFAHLEELDLSENVLSGAHLAELQTVCASVKVERQRLDEMDEDFRYVAVGE